MMGNAILAYLGQNIVGIHNNLQAYEVTISLQWFLPVLTDE
jgi:hypothetical protein